MSVLASCYFDPTTGEEDIHSGRLKRLSKSRQIEIMRHWFGARYEDPANSISYCSQEGGYIYLGNGPFDAREELGKEFGGVAKDEAIEELVDELEQYSTDWAYTTQYQDELGFFDDYDVEAALDPNIPIDAVYLRLGKLRKLLAQKEMMDGDVQEFQRMMLFTFCITTLESFLADVFIKSVLSSQANKEKFLCVDSKLSQQSFPLTQIYSRFEEMDMKIKARLTETSFHNLATAKRLYKKVLGIELGEISALEAAVFKRHDFIHRGGRDKEGEPVTTTVDEIRTLIDAIEGFCKLVEARFTFSSVVVIPPPASDA